MTPKTDRFMREFEVAQQVQRVALERYNATMNLEQAHACWAEHSDDYCAGWLAPDSENPAKEMLHALTKFQERHGKLPIARARCDDPPRQPPPIGRLYRP